MEDDTVLLCGGRTSMDPGNIKDMVFSFKSKFELPRLFGRVHPL